MSILDIWITPESALIGVDTEAVMTTDGTLHEVSKMVPIVHMPAVIAYRGIAGFFLAAVCLARIGGDFDTLMEGLPAILSRSFSDFIKLAPKDAPIDQQCIVLVGWSRRQGRVIGREFTQQNREAGFVAADIAHCFEAPHLASLDLLPERPTCSCRHRPH